MNKYVNFMNQKMDIMEGIMYGTDENNKRFVKIDLEKHGTVLEDILDRLAIESRRGEESYPIDEVLKELKEKGNLDKYV